MSIQGVSTAFSPVGPDIPRMLRKLTGMHTVIDRRPLKIISLPARFDAASSFLAIGCARGAAL